MSSNPFTWNWKIGQSLYIVQKVASLQPSVFYLFTWKKRIFNLDSFNYLAMIEVLGKKFIGSALVGGGDDEGIPKAS